MERIKIEYPDWHDKARAMRACGDKVTAIADHFGISAAQIYKIASVSWKQYLLMYRKRYEDRAGMHVTDFNPSGYEFVPVPSKSPIEKERERNAQKRHYTPKEPEEMPRGREFDSIKKHDDVSNKLQQGYKITCSKCGRIEEHVSNKGMIPFDFMAKKFSQRGWIVGGSSRADQCPECAAKLRKHKEVAAPDDGVSFVFPPVKPVQEVKPVLTETLNPVSHDQTRPHPEKPNPIPQIIAQTAPKYDDQTRPQAEGRNPPALVNGSVSVSKLGLGVPVEPVVKPAAPTITADVMDRTTKRIIFSKLNDVYADEKTGYSGDWTDAKVAADLGVSVDWVREVRDEDFGPETNAEIRAKSHGDLINLAGRIEQHILLVDKKLSAIEALDDKVSTALEECKRCVARYEELTNNLKTNDDQMKVVIDTFNGMVEEFDKKFADLKSSPSV